MHLPDNLLHGSIGILSSLLVLGLLLAAAWPGTRHTHAIRPFEFASVSAFLFAMQMIQFPVGSGTSGHMVGGVLATILLGIRSGMIAMALVTVAQCLLFSVGGLSLLGTNILNTAIIAAALGGWLSRKIVLGLPQKRFCWCLAPAVASFLSVQAVCIACAIELAWGGAAPLSVLIGPVFLNQLPVAVLEGFLTFTAVWLLTMPSDDPDQSPLPVTISMRVVWTFLAALLAATVAAPFSSQDPPALEVILAHLSWWKIGSQMPFGILNGYYVDDVAGKISISLAGLLGVCTIFLIGWAMEQGAAHLQKWIRLRRSLQAA